MTSLTSSFNDSLIYSYIYGLGSWVSGIQIGSTLRGLYLIIPDSTLSSDLELRLLAGIEFHEAGQVDLISNRLGAVSPMNQFRGELLLDVVEPAEPSAILKHMARGTTE